MYFSREYRPRGQLEYRTRGQLSILQNGNWSKAISMGQLSAVFYKKQVKYGYNDYSTVHTKGGNCYCTSDFFKSTPSPSCWLS